MNCIAAFVTTVLAVAGIMAPAAAPHGVQTRTTPTPIRFEGEAFRSSIENATFIVDRFSVKNGKVVALGVASGDVYFVGGPCIDGMGTPGRCHLYERSFSSVRFAWPVGAVSASCSGVEVRLARIGGTFDARPWGDRWIFFAATVQLGDGAPASCPASPATRGSPHALAAFLSRLV